MKFKKIIVHFHSENLVLAEELICNIFFSFDLKGVVCDVPLDEPDEGFGTHTLPKPAICSITGFLPLIDASDIILEKIKEETSSLLDFNIKTDIKTQIVDEKDWSDAWKDYFDVTPITDRITIKPLWKDHEAKQGELVIHLDPGMAFGTGTHPTTAMCLRLIETYLVPGSTFLDVGTGSGILMIAAALLGAKHLTGIDTDEIAITVARQNLAKNNIKPDIFDLECTRLDEIVPRPCNFIAANIIAQVIVDILPDILMRMTPDTIVVLSGIIKDRLDDVQEALKTNHLRVIHEEYMDEWLALAVKKATG